MVHSPPATLDDGAWSCVIASILELAGNGVSISENSGFPYQTTHKTVYQPPEEAERDNSTKTCNKSLETGTRYLMALDDRPPDGRQQSAGYGAGGSKG